MNEDKLVHLANFYNPNEAEIARGFLESHDVFCFLQNANLMKTVSYLQNNAGGVRLMVLLSDFDEAYDILAGVEGDHGLIAKPVVSHSPSLLRTLVVIVSFVFGGVFMPRASQKKREDDLFS